MVEQGRHVRRTHGRAHVSRPVDFVSKAQREPHVATAAHREAVGRRRLRQLLRQLLRLLLRLLSSSLR